MLKKISNLKGAQELNEAQMRNVRGGITQDMANCVVGAWKCWQPAFCRTKCPASYCCNECPSSCVIES